MTTTKQKFDSLYDLEYQEEQFKQKVKNWEIKLCENPLHHDYTVDEICIDKKCPMIYEPICSACKFKNHQNHETQQLKVFLLDLITDTFRGNSINMFDDQNDDKLKNDKLYNELQTVLQNCEVLVNKSKQLLSNFRDIYNQYRDINLIQDPQKFNVRKILLQIMYSKGQQELANNLSNLRGEIFTQKKEAFVYTKFDSDSKKSNIVFNCKTIVDAMESNIQKINVMYAKLLDVSNPLKVSRQWIDRFKNDADLQHKISEHHKNYYDYADAKPSQSEIFMPKFTPYRTESYQEDVYKREIEFAKFNKNKSTLFGQDYSKYISNNNQYNQFENIYDKKSSFDNNNSQVFQLNNSMMDRPTHFNDLSRRQKYLWGLISEMKEKMNQHTQTCKNRLCKQVVQDMVRGSWQIMTQDKNPLTQLACERGQKLNNEMRLLKAQFDECYKY